MGVNYYSRSKPNRTTGPMAEGPTLMVSRRRIYFCKPGGAYRAPKFEFHKHILKKNFIRQAVKEYRGTNNRRGNGEKDERQEGSRGQGPDRKTDKRGHVCDRSHDGLCEA